MVQAKVNNASASKKKKTVQINEVTSSSTDDTTNVTENQPIDESVSEPAVSSSSQNEPEIQPKFSKKDKKTLMAILEKAKAPKISNTPTEGCSWPMEVSKANIYFDYEKKKAVFYKIGNEEDPNIQYDEKQRFDLKPLDYEVLYEEFTRVKNMHKRELDNAFGPVVYTKNIFLPQSSNKYKMKIEVLRTAYGYSAYLRVVPLCKEGFARTKVVYSPKAYYPDALAAAKKAAAKNAAEAADAKANDDSGVDKDNGDDDYDSDLDDCDCNLVMKKNKKGRDECGTGKRVSYTLQSHKLTSTFDFDCTHQLVDYGFELLRSDKLMTPPSGWYL